MPKIISAFASPSPIGRMMSSIGRQLTRNAPSALDQQKLYDLQRQSTEIENLARLTAEQGAHALGSNPQAQAMLLLSGLDPSKFGDVGLMSSATTLGAKDPMTQDWQVGTGQPFANTFDAFSTKAAETARNNDMQSADRRYNTDQRVHETARQFNMEPKPVRRADGSIGFERRNDLPLNGNQPILSETETKGGFLQEHFDDLGALSPEQRQVLGANPSSSGRTPRNYIAPDNTVHMTYDGVTDAQTDELLPPGGHIGTVEGSAADVGVSNRVEAGLQDELISGAKLGFLFDEAMDLTELDPTLFGPVGLGRSLLQELAQGASGIAQLFGPDSQGAAELRQAQEDLRANGLAGALPELYDPNLSKVQTLWGLIVYQGAATLAGQSGRSVSDKDIGFMKQILGDPQSLFSSAQSMRSKLTTAKSILQRFSEISSDALREGAPLSTAPGAPTQDGPPTETSTWTPEEIEDAYARARAAIAAGANAEEVRKRLSDSGIDPGGL